MGNGHWIMMSKDFLFTSTPSSFKCFYVCVILAKSRENFTIANSLERSTVPRLSGSNLFISWNSLLPGIERCKFRRAAENRACFAITSAFHRTSWRAERVQHLQEGYIGIKKEQKWGVIDLRGSPVWVSHFRSILLNWTGCFLIVTMEGCFTGLPWWLSDSSVNSWIPACFCQSSCEVLKKSRRRKSRSVPWISRILSSVLFFKVPSSQVS